MKAPYMGLSEIVEEAEEMLTRMKDEGTATVEDAVNALIVEYSIPEPIAVRVLKQWIKNAPFDEAAYRAWKEQRRRHGYRL